MQQLAKLEISEVPVDTYHVSETTRDSRHWQSAVAVVCKVAAVCRSGIAEGLMSRLQSAQNAAARLMSGARRYDHIMPVLQELHSVYWLPVSHRVDLRMATPVYLSLSSPSGHLARLRRRSLSTEFYRIKDVCCQQSDGHPTAIFFQLQIRNCVTAFHLICDKMTLNFNDLNG